MLPGVLVVFFVSGFAALLYQVTWQRLLAAYSGADVYSVTVTVAAFMLGLGCGNLAGGHLADRLSRRANLAAFAVAELAIAGFGFFSKFLYYDFLYLKLGHLATAPGSLAVVLFVSLLWPTALMGASLPLLARAVTRDVRRAAPVIGWLYGLNTLGAAFGALVTTWLLMPQLGLEGALEVGWTLNLAAAALAALLAAGLGARRSTAAPTDVDSRTTPGAQSDGAPAGPGLLGWMLVYGVSGFIALSLEIVWFRLLGVVVKPTAFVFGTLIGVYLMCVGLGSALGGLFSSRSRNPAAVFLVSQATIPCMAGGTVAAAVWLVDRMPALAELSSYLGRYESLDVYASVAHLRDAVAGSGKLPWDFLSLYVFIPLVVMGLSTLLMGFSFPFLQKVLQTKLSLVGRRTGLLLLSNIVGSTLGTILTGWFALEYLGTVGSLRMLCGFGGLFVVLWARAATRARPSRLPGMLVAGLCPILVVIVALPSGATMWSRLHGTTAERIIVSEDQTGLSVLKSENDTFSQRTWVYVNGFGQSVIPYGELHTVLGLLPVLIHSAPRGVAVIGLGSGDTCFAAAARSETHQVTCIEIVRPQLATLREFARRSPDPGVRALLLEKRIEHVAGDGRAWIKQAGRRFDIIEADALQPYSPYSGYLYSQEYFALLSAHLAPGGLAVSWCPTGRVLGAILRSFPHVLVIDNVAIASNSPVAFDRDQIRSRLGDAAVQRYFATGGVSASRWIEPFLTKEIQRFGPDLDRSTLLDFNTDLFPRDEFNLPGVIDLSRLCRALAW